MATHTHSGGTRHSRHTDIPVERGWLSRAIDGITETLGHQLAVLAALVIVVGWLLGGFAIGFTNTYQLVINTGTTIITFVMVFAIQHTANRETRAMNLKLDELLHATGGKVEYIGAEDHTEEHLKQEQKREQRYRTRSAGDKTAAPAAKP